MPMTEADWVACNSCDRALLMLRKRVSNRKLRLFACACCRAIESLLPEGTVRETLAAAEEYAEGRIGRTALRAAREAAMPAVINFSDMAGHVARITVVRAAH